MPVKTEYRHGCGNKEKDLHGGGGDDPSSDSVSCILHCVNRTWRSVLA